MKKRRSAEERALAAARLFYRDGLSDDDIRNTYLYQKLRRWQIENAARNKRLREERAENKAKREASR